MALLSLPQCMQLSSNQVPLPALPPHLVAVVVEPQRAHWHPRVVLEEQRDGLLGAGAEAAQAHLQTGAVGGGAQSAQSASTLQLGVVKAVPAAAQLASTGGSEEPASEHGSSSSAGRSRQHLFFSAWASRGRLPRPGEYIRRPCLGCCIVGYSSRYSSSC